MVVILKSIIHFYNSFLLQPFFILLYVGLWWTSTYQPTHLHLLQVSHALKQTFDTLPTDMLL